jgi:hypothetical protein
MPFAIVNEYRLAHGLKLAMDQGLRSLAVSWPLWPW